MLQSAKFDPRGEYLRRWVPELASLPDEAVHAPWRQVRAAPGAYPPPLVDLGVSRQRALAAYARIKAG